MPWGVVATAAVAAYSSYEEQQAAEDKEKNNKELSELGFQRQAWLDQQQRHIHCAHTCQRALH